MPGAQELLVIAVVALLVFGPDRLPEMMRQGARLLARFREQSQQSIDELKRAAELDELDRELRGLRREVREATTLVDREARDAAAMADPRPSRAAGRRERPEAAPVGDDAAGGARPPMDPEAT